MNLPYVIFKAGKTEYKLKFSALASVRLEKKLGCSVYQGFKRLNEINAAAEFLKASLMRYHPDIDEKDAYGIYDDFTDAGGTLEEFAGIMTEVMTVSGFLKRELAP